MELEGEVAVLAAMAAPAVLLLGNAMLILSTNQRLQNILERVRETELTMVGQDAAPEISDLELLNELLLTHARRARYAHRALLSFYTSTGLFMLMWSSSDSPGSACGRWMRPSSRHLAVASCSLWASSYWSERPGSGSARWTAVSRISWRCAGGSPTGGPEDGGRGKLAELSCNFTLTRHRDHSIQG